MKCIPRLEIFCVLIFMMALGGGAVWGQVTFQTDYETAMARSVAEGKDLLVVFSGSDWCKPCIQLKQDVLQSADFEAYWTENLVILNLDFPFRKKNALPPAQQAHHEQLAERYNPKGEFPLSLLLRADGSVAKRVTYKPNSSPADFIDQLKTNL